jgi:exopolysaccharide biosynthesis protein
MGSTRVIVDTATDGDCRDNCSVLSLGDYVSRNGAFAGINGSYFCPADYPSCSGKSNTFDTLAMNKNKKYINADNNVYSTVPAVIFQSGSMRFVGQSLEWGRDTGVDGVLANQPLLLSGGNVVFTGGSDPKQGSKGSRSFVGNKGSTAYIGVVRNVTVAEMAHVLKTLGLENALNLDSGGSTALWSGGYKAGPGRNIPNAVLFIRK